ncbi:MAG: M23 family metallopeptidase [Bacteroidetes bacterium]|nr:M23 family metallopeptidase [Bacteroidota bacterium]
MRRISVVIRFAGLGRASAAVRLTAFFLLASSFCYAGTFGTLLQNPANESYRFPTDASHQINSGFADYRETHFHGGIDISTNGKIGYPVYAAKSGFVYRVSVSPYGYGRMILLRHDDSTFTLYGHLSQFSKKIQEKVEAAQKSEGKYGVRLRFQPGEIRFRRGEIIARTGATGVGGPHLHFEIHGKNYSYVDPLIHKSLDVIGYRTPRIFNVAVREFNSGKVEVSSVSKAGGEYRAKENFDINEPFYFIVHAADSYGRDNFKRPPKHIALKIDGKSFISLNLTRIDADDYLDVASLVDLQLSRGYKTYYMLCVNRAIPFSVFTPSSPLSGLVDQRFANGVHTYQITVKDEDGNEAAVSGEFVLNIPKSQMIAKGSLESDPPVPLPFEQRTIRPSSSLTIEFPANCFTKQIDVAVRQQFPDSFQIEPTDEPLRKKLRVLWKVDDARLRLYRKLRHGWSYVPCRNDGKILTADVGYRTGDFTLLRDNVPPIVDRIRVSRRNPFYRSVAPNEFNRVFVYFKVADRLSGISADDILLKVGKKNYFCEYDVDKHAAVCKVDAGLLRRQKRITVVVADNAGNERIVDSKVKVR